MPKKKKTENPSGIVLLAKNSGITSFSSLWSVKKALNTDKVGHTGTLDSFADGLLVVLTGSLTHLVSHITNLKKTYLAVVCFGKETDTLDPTGNVVEKGNALTREEVESLCTKFRGALLQVPPVFSAVHVQGKRASDLARKGNDVNLPARQVFIYKNKLIDYKAPDETDPCSYALLEIECSKGTYIRALARDMAKSAGSVAHLQALRRTRIGPFSLYDAAGVSQLGEFTVANALSRDDNEKSRPEIFADIRNRFFEFTPRTANSLGFKSEVVNPEFEKSYLNGRPLSEKMFTPLPVVNQTDFEAYRTPEEIAVFYENGQFAGLTHIADEKLEYGFLVPKKNNILKVFTWEQIRRDDFPQAWKSKGTALTIGGFDALHAGHLALIDRVLSQDSLVKGIVTFRSAFKGETGEILSDVMSLSQKYDFFREKGLQFVILIDFSTDFSRITGDSFFSTLQSSCNLKYIAEGRDFTCGYKGSFSKNEIESFALDKGISYQFVDDIDISGSRVSSSRIRNEIQNGDMTQASVLLGRPFVYDCADVRWKTADKSDVQLTLTFTSASNQILPQKCGEYEVSALVKKADVSDGGFDSVSAKLIVSEESISLVCPADTDYENIVYLQFCA